MAQIGEVKAVLFSKLHASESLLKGERKRIRTWAAVGGAEVERGAVPACRKTDDVVPSGVGRRLTYITGRQDRSHQLLRPCSDSGFLRGGVGVGTPPTDGR